MQLDEAVKIFPEMSISLTRYPPVFDQYYGDVLLFFLRKVHLPDARPPVFAQYSERGVYAIRSSGKDNFSKCPSR